MNVPLSASIHLDSPATLSAISPRMSADSAGDCSASRASWTTIGTSSGPIINLKGREMSILQEGCVSSYNYEACEAVDCKPWRIGHTLQTWPAYLL
jgi:hypothetical protein